MTRFYLPSTGASAVNPAFDAGWAENSSADRLKCVTTKIGSSMTDKTVAKGTGATRALVRQYVSDPIAAQTLVGSAGIKGQVRCLESAANDNLDLVPCCIRVVSNDGSTFRSPAALALGDYAPALEFATSLTNRKIADGDLSTEVVASQGDRIVIEIGEKNSGTGSSVSGTFNFGDNSATDLAEDTTTTAANNPWVELQNEIAFVGDTTLGQWSDNLNAQQAPIKALVRITQTTGGSGVAMGDTATNEAWGQRFTATADGKLLRVRFFPQTLGSPTDSLVCKLYSDSSGLPGTLLNTSLPILASTITSTTSARPFEFAIPTMLVNNGVYHAICWRTGSLDASNRYSLDAVASNPYAGGNAIKRTFGTWEDQSTTRDMRFDVEIESPNWYKFEIDRDDAVLRALRSTDGGANWTEQDASNAPALANASGRFGCAVQRKGAKFYVVIAGSIESLKKNFPFDTSSNTWGSPTTRNFTVGGIGFEVQLGVNVGGVCPIFHSYREYSTAADANKNYSVFQGMPELVGATRYRRILVQQGTSEGWLTGASATVHYDHRSAAADWRDWFYIFYSKSDSTQIQVATLSVDSSTPTVVGGLSSTAIDQTAKYPLGLGCHFWRDGVNYVAVPYVDAGTSKLLYCESGTPANTAGNWTTGTITTQAAETVTSNPGFVVADNEQGGKLYYFFVDDSNGKLYYCNDGGSFTWTTPLEFDTTVVEGCAGTLSDRTIGVLMRNSSGALIFRTLDVFF